MDYGRLEETSSTFLKYSIFNRSIVIQSYLLTTFNHLQGEIEGILVDRKDMQTYIMRPGMVVSKGTWLPEMVRNTIRAQTVNEVAAVTIDLALNGSKEQTWNPNEITRYGRSLSR